MINMIENFLNFSKAFISEQNVSDENVNPPDISVAQIKTLAKEDEMLKDLIHNYCFESVYQLDMADTILNIDILDSNKIKLKVQTIIENKEELNFLRKMQDAIPRAIKKKINNLIYQGKMDESRRLRDKYVSEVVEKERKKDDSILNASEESVFMDREIKLNLKDENAIKETGEKIFSALKEIKDAIEKDDFVSVF
jgi:hypothetical protein